MGTDLQSTLRSLCFNTDWKYAVFWKLKHRARMVLTWEDAYYENCEQLDPIMNKCFRETMEKMCHGHYSHNPLGLAVAKMSYHVYSLGEGVVGQVAVSGKHRWIIADKHVISSISSLEFSDGWQSQLSAGIKTIVVVAVVPYGVVQIGSFNKVAEDVKLVTHIRDIFSSFQDSSVGYVTTPLQYDIKNPSYLPDLPLKGLEDPESQVVTDSLSNRDKATVQGVPDYQLPMFPYLPKHGDTSSYVCSLLGIHQNRSVEAVNRNRGCGISIPSSDENVNLVHLRPNISYLGQQNQVGINLPQNHPFFGKNDPSGSGSESNLIPHLNNSTKGHISLCDVLPCEKFGTDLVNFPPEVLDSILCGGPIPDGISFYTNMPESSNVNQKKDMEKLEYQVESGHLGTSNTFLKFSTGFELHEALGPAFSKGCLYFGSESEKTEARNIVEVPEVKSISDMTCDSSSENLLEAVVGSICYGGRDWKSEKSASKSSQSLLTAEKTPKPSSHIEHIIHSSGYSIKEQSVIQEDTQRCSSSTGAYGALSSKGFPSICASACSEQLDRHSEPAKGSKKRARPGENCRPRPRDRQLIQDRIKELRELVPNGAKCSIDSLLERTIKHMLFMESITKHADKLNKCAESKMHQKGADSSSYEKGSSWAVEVGGHLKVSSIIVENLNKNGQMIVEMLCEECSHFLEIAEAIRSLGLTILKGITEVHGDKTWICFMVEGQNNRVMHRMDILWSLVQTLQPKTST